MSEYVDADGVAYENYQEYVENLAGLCGCRSDEVANDLVAILKTYLGGFTYYVDLPIAGPEKYRELLLHVLDNAGLIEHGGSVRGSWLTDSGKDVAQKLRDEA